ncbi:MAG: single-stranded-DNA-specific exonuclease RecJ [bacterium]
MNKIWQVAAPISQEVINNNPDLHPVILQLLHNRGLIEASARHDFLQGAPLADPFLFANMQAACQLIIEQIKAGHKIAIVGDYDADGVTASAVLSESLQALQAKTAVWIPSRLGEGYGLNQRIIDEVIADDCQLLITVDNGIKSQAEVVYAQERGLAVIITDHHTPPALEAMPQCLVINPMAVDQGYPYKALAGVGVAFKLASALISLSKLGSEQKKILMDSVLDLVAIGTVGDCVSLLGENRDLVKQGLARLNHRPRLGINELLRTAGLQLPINEWHIGWQIVPRLNVAGRLEHANSAYQLLIAKDKTEARESANHLQQQNISRQNMTKQILDACSRQVETAMFKQKILILLAPDVTTAEGESWSEGVVGLVAGRLSEKYHKPAVVICRSEGQIKGSARSLEQFNIVQALDQVQDCLERYGGHKMAAGFTVKPDHLEELIDRLQILAAQALVDVDLRPQLKIDAELTCSAIDDKLIDQLEILAPFGTGNQQPVFISRDCQITDLAKIGNEGQHYRLSFGTNIGIAFSAGYKWPELKIGDKIDIVYHLEWNYFNGRKSLQLKILDIQYD